MEQAMAATRSSTYSKASSLGNISIQVLKEWGHYKAEEATEMEKNKMDSQVLYTEEKGMLKRLFNGSQSHDDSTWEVVLKKLKEGVIQVRLRKGDVKVLTRSLSVGSPRRLSADNGTRLDRFKIRTLDVKQGGGEGGPQVEGSK